MVAELDGQPVHTSAPVAALNVSAAHATGVPPFAPVYPAFATQAVLADDPVAATVPELDVHAVHGAEDAEDDL